LKILKGKYSVEVEKRSILGSLFEIPSTQEKTYGYYNYATRVGGFGPLFTVLFLPSLFFAFLIGLLKRDKNVLLLFMIYFFIYMVLPYKWWTRFHIYIMGISITSFSYILFHLSSSFYILGIIFSTLSFISAHRNIPKFHIQNYFPYKWRKLYFSERSYLLKDAKNIIFPYLEKGDTIGLYYSPEASEKYNFLLKLSYIFIPHDYEINIKYIFPPLKNMPPSAKFIITPSFFKSFNENYTLVYHNRDFEIWRRK